MQTTIFDGRDFAAKKLEVLSNRAKELQSKGVKANLVSIIVGDDPASILYQNLKKKAAERIGAEVIIKVYPDGITKDVLMEEIENLNNIEYVTGIMIQLPLPESFSDTDRDEIIKSISAQKDVDGLRENSKFTPPTAKAVLEVLNNALSLTSNHNPHLSICVVGASGFIGRQIVNALNNEYMPPARKDLWPGGNTRIKGIRMGDKEVSNKKSERIELKIIEANSKTKNLKLKIKNSDVVISVTGVADLITAEMVKDGAILIDVGAPKGDIAKEAYSKASFVSPVPGGVGPVTIASLMENLINAAF
jgi:methylenetetrahydrofolate dehydrogenase (NADP+) / methenyltetrahydrofolate cyclohydrolase